MIDVKELIRYQKEAEEGLKDYSGLTLNHFGFKTPDARSYEMLKKEMGEVLSEVVYNGRRIATVQGTDYLFEIMEPMAAETVPETFLDHISYIAEDFTSFSEMFSNDVITRFDVGGTHGLKFSPKPGIMIEIRNNDLRDTAKDFSS